MTSLWKRAVHALSLTSFHLNLLKVKIGQLEFNPFWFSITIWTFSMVENMILPPDDLSMEACCAIKYFPEVDSLQSEKVLLVSLSRPWSLKYKNTKYENTKRQQKLTVFKVRRYCSKSSKLFKVVQSCWQSSKWEGVVDLSFQTLIFKI